MSQAENERLTRLVWTGPALSRAIASIAEIGMADLIEPGQSQPVNHLSNATKTDQGVLYRVLRFLASHGIFQETQNRHFDHTALSAVLRTDAPGSYRGAARLLHPVFAAWDGLHHSLYTGEPGFQKAFGAPVFDYIVAHPELGPLFDAGMTSMNFYETGAMIDAYDFTGVDVLADVGGGNGSLISALLQRYPKMKGILFDQDHVAGRAQENLRSSGVGDRCTVIAGNFFEAIPSGADAYLFRHIIHDWTDEQSIQILRQCRQVIPANGRLLIVDSVVPAGNAPSPAKDYDILMLTYPGGRERTEEEFRTLCTAAAFEVTSITPTPTMISVVTARPV
jgi:hypothetical protein